MKDKGLIVIEDTHTSYMDGFGDAEFSFIGYAKERIDKINMRFGGFHERAAERRFWSMEITESMVAFRINRAATALKSEPILNIGSSLVAQDFRHEDPNSLASVGCVPSSGVSLGLRLDPMPPRVR